MLEIVSLTDWKQLALRDWDLESESKCGGKVA